MRFWLESQREKDHLGILRSSCMNNIKSGLAEVEWGVVDCIVLARTLVNAVMNLRAPLKH
jgi:hypothetical protein